MSVQLRDGTIFLLGDCPVEDGPTLADYCGLYPQAAVDWSQCEWLHTGVFQVLLAFRPDLRGTPAGDFVRTHVARMLARNGLGHGGLVNSRPNH